MRSPEQIRALTARGRAAAEVLMVDRVRIWRDSTEAPTVDKWGKVTPADPDLIYEGPAKAQNDRMYPAGTEVGEVARVATTVSAVHLPYGTTSVRAGDVCEWVSSENPRLVGARVRLRSDEDKTLQTAVRFNVQEVIS